MTRIYLSVSVIILLALGFRLGYLKGAGQQMDWPEVVMVAGIAGLTFALLNKLATGEPT